MQRSASKPLLRHSRVHAGWCCGDSGFASSPYGITGSGAHRAGRRIGARPVAGEGGGEPAVHHRDADILPGRDGIREHDRFGVRDEKHDGRANRWPVFVWIAVGVELEVGMPGCLAEHRHEEAEEIRPEQPVGVVDQNSKVWSFVRLPWPCQSRRQSTTASQL